MKKRFVFVIAITIVIFALTLICNACGKTNATEPDTNKENDVYAQLNEMLNNAGYPVTVTSKTTESEVVFNGSYAITESGGVFYSVDYSYEKLSTFEIKKDGEIICPGRV